MKSFSIQLEDCEDPEGYFRQDNEKVNETKQTIEFLYEFLDNQTI